MKAKIRLQLLSANRQLPVPHRYMFQHRLLQHPVPPVSKLRFPERLTINVKVGDQVKRGDTLVVMEAMKMENNIMANKDGQVKAIHVTVGQTVVQDDKLVDLQ